MEHKTDGSSGDVLCRGSLRLCDLDQRVAIIRSGEVDSPVLRMLIQGRGFNAFGWDNTLIVVFCAPLNVPLSKMEDAMNEVRNAC